jgi:Spy/CpxP family protein refolding chaperone
LRKLTLKRAILGSAAAGAMLVAGTAAAAGNSGTTKPGWGYGDKNHVHTGPPGQSVKVQKNH